MLGPHFDPSREYSASKHMRQQQENQVKDGRTWERKGRAHSRLTRGDVLLLGGLLIAVAALVFLLLSWLA